MRIEKDHPQLPAVKRGEKMTIWIDGREATAYAGETVSAVMIAEGTGAYGYSDKPVNEIHIDQLSTARLPFDKLPLDKLRGRGVSGFFCGMGVCYGCILLVDGLRRRACLTAVRDGMVILTRPLSANVQETGYTAGPDNE